MAAVARQAGVAGSGYRVIANTGPDSGQEVVHLHWHLHRRPAARRHGMIREAGALETRIKADTVVALKAGDKRRTQALRLLTAALKKERIDAGATPDEAAEIVVLKRERKRRLEAAELYDGAGRAELAAQERYEEELIVVYLPPELGDDELAAIVDETIADIGRRHRPRTWAR